jgi:hypothetical protein
MFYGTYKTLYMYFCLLPRAHGLFQLVVLDETIRAVTNEIAPKPSSCKHADNVTSCWKIINDNDTKTLFLFLFLFFLCSFPLFVVLCCSFVCSISLARRCALGAAVPGRFADRPVSRPVISSSANGGKRTELFWPNSFFLMFVNAFSGAFVAGRRKNIPSCKVAKSRFS